MKKLNVRVAALLFCGAMLATSCQGLVDAIWPWEPAEVNKPATTPTNPTMPTKVAVTAVTLDKTELTLTAGVTYQLTATVTPANATDADVTWSSSDESVAKVDGTGLVTTVADGTATITAKAGDKTAICTVTVAPILVTSVTLNKTTTSITIGANETLTATVEPKDATDPTVAWSSDKTNIATVDANGKVTGVAAGEATITATAGDKKATCTVTVTTATVAVTGITLNKSNLTLTPNDTGTLCVTAVAPTTATDQTVTWSSDKTSVATVDTSTGKVTAVAAGTATITATANDGSGVKATCAVTVKALENETLTTATADVTTYNGTNITIKAESEYGAVCQAEGIPVDNIDNAIIETKNGKTIKKIEFTIGMGEGNASNLSSSVGTISVTDGNTSGSVTGIDATSVTISNSEIAVININSFTVYYY